MNKLNPEHGMGWNKPDELDEIIASICADHDGLELCKFCVEDKKKLLVWVAAQTAKAVAEVETRHQEIYAWLLGLRSDFPASEPGARYNWRSYLRKKIPGDMLLRINKEPNSAPSPAQENE